MILNLATTNPAKQRRLRRTLESGGFEVRLPGREVEVEESGGTAQENAVLKAVAWAKKLGCRVIATDEALQLDGVEPNEQPGTHVRRIPGFSGRPSDDEMLDYYIGLVKKHGGTMIGRWQFAFSVADPDGRHWDFERMAPDRRFVDVASPVRIAGQPLSSIQQDIGTGRYISELSAEDSDNFWHEHFDRYLLEFLRGIPAN